MVLQGPGHLGEAIAGQVDQPPAGEVQGKEIDQLGLAGGLRGPGETVPLHNRVDRAGFAAVGTTGERHLDAIVGDTLVGFVRA